MGLNSLPTKQSTVAKNLDTISDSKLPLGEPEFIKKMESEESAWCEVEKKIVSAEEKSSREEVETHREEVEASQLEEAGDSNQPEKSRREEVETQKFKTSQLEEAGDSIQQETSSSSFKFDKVNRGVNYELDNTCDAVSSLSDEFGVSRSAESRDIDFFDELDLGASETVELDMTDVSGNLNSQEERSREIDNASSYDSESTQPSNDEHNESVQPGPSSQSSNNKPKRSLYEACLICDKSVKKTRDHLNYSHKLHKNPVLKAFLSSYHSTLQTKKCYQCHDCTKRIGFKRPTHVIIDSQEFLTGRIQMDSQKTYK